MSGEKEKMLNPELYSLAENLVIIQELLNHRENLITISLDEVLTEDHRVEDLNALADQYLLIDAQLRVFREDCGSRGTQAELDMVDEILMDLRSEIANL